MVSSEGIDPDLTWDYVKTVRAKSEAKDWSNCSVLVPVENRLLNMDSLSQLLNISDSSDEVKELSRSQINKAAHMFIFLNSCEQTPYWKTAHWSFFFTSLNWEPLPSIILTLLKTIENSSGDGRALAERVLKKLYTVIKMDSKIDRLIKPELGHLDLLKNLSGDISTRTTSPRCLSWVIDERQTDRGKKGFKKNNM